MVPDRIDTTILNGWISDLENLPSQLKNAVAKLNEAALQKPYRSGGWTKKQVINHIADSHCNGFMRTKLALTEDKPIIKPYTQNLWAELEDGKNSPVEVSLSIIEGVHHRWVLLVKSLSESELNRTFIHPEYNLEYSIKASAGNYAWHGKHHLMHILQ